VIVLPVGEDEEGVAGVYPVILSEDIDSFFLADIALDVFHSNTTISVLEDYDIIVINKQDVPLKRHPETYKIVNIMEQALKAQSKLLAA
jgi:hypothetical protein